MNWNEGYVVDVEYTTGFFQELSPTYLNTVCVLNGIEPVALDKPFHYCELGCGQGFSANVLAASHPQGNFYAVDFMPAHIARAQELADAASLRNLTLLESSFSDLAEGRVLGLPQFDFITLHGVYTWVSPENRRHVVNFIARHLKPGGIVYVSYNTMPGWASALPLQKLLMEFADQHPDRSDNQVRQARGLFENLTALGAQFFSANADNHVFGKRLDSLLTDKESYLVHEYMNRDWQPVYFADVARHLAEAKLEHAGSTTLLTAFPQLYFTPAQRQLLNGFADPVMRETVKDYLLNTSFRMDVFVRGARHMAPARQADWLRRMGLALTAAQGAITLDQAWATAWIGEKRDWYEAVLAALEDGPKTLPELLATRGLSGCNLGDLAEIGAFLAKSGQGAMYFADAAATDVASARAMNRAIAAQSQFGDHYQTLVSPLLGNGIGAGLVQRLVYAALLQAENADEALADPRELTRQVAAWLRQQDTAKDKTAETEDKTKAELADTVRAILERRLPVWRQLRMI